MLIAELLAQPRISMLTRSAANELVKIQNKIDHKLLIEDRSDIEKLLGQLLAAGAPVRPRTLDLIGHSTADHSLLVLGDWVIDASSPTVTAFFREVADHDVLPRLGITAVRLLGCLTANTAAGRRTMCALADILGVEVWGTKDVVYSVHYDRGGFAEERTFCLVSSTELRDDARHASLHVRGEPHPRVLDIDSLPATPLAADREWVYRVADHRQARALLRTVRRREGAKLPGLLATPSCEIALPSPDEGRYYCLQLLLDCELVRVYPDGFDAPAVVYPVDDPHALASIVEQLPAVHSSS